MSRNGSHRSIAMVGTSCKPVVCVCVDIVGQPKHIYKPQNVCQAVAARPVIHPGATTLEARGEVAGHCPLGMRAWLLEAGEEVILRGRIPRVRDRRRHQHKWLISHELPQLFW